MGLGTLEISLREKVGHGNENCCTALFTLYDVCVGLRTEESAPLVVLEIHVGGLSFGLVFRLWGMP